MKVDPEWLQQYEVYRVAPELPDGEHLVLMPLIGGRWRVGIADEWGVGEHWCFGRDITDAVGFMLAWPREPTPHTWKRHFHPGKGYQRNGPTAVWSWR